MRLNDSVNRIREWVTRRAIAAVPDGPLLVLDIDNTLAHTAASYPRRERRDWIRLAQIEPILEMRQGVHDPAVRGLVPVVFLSHRQFSQFPLTWWWLRRNGFAARSDNLILVRDVADKVPILAELAQRCEVEVWDDLCAGHHDPNMNTRFYAEVIDQVRHLPVAYHGVDEILAVCATSEPPR